MPESGSQICICDFPIRIDSYAGCSHSCKYCFAHKKHSINKIEKHETAGQLERFIEGERGIDTNWCDWKIPLHWGGMSDPFQPIEKKERVSLEMLKVFARTKYPFIVSTKGKLIIEDEYLELLKECNCVVQISAVCSKYDKIELGAPTFEERLHMASVLSKVVKRVNIRMQPYFTECLKDALENIPRLADAGVYGVIVEGMKFSVKKQGLVKVGGDLCYPLEIIKSHFITIKNRCHEYGLKCYAGENRIRKLGDSLSCCGVDGLEGFTGNTFNANHILIDPKSVLITDAMKTIGSAKVMRSYHQKAGYFDYIKNRSFEEQMKLEIQTGKYNEILGVKNGN